MDHQRAPRQCQRTTAPAGPRMLGSRTSSAPSHPHQRNRSCMCVGHAIVQGDEAPDCGVAQGAIHGVPVRHGEKQEEEEGEIKQEVKGNKEEDNNQTPVRMSMDEME